MCGRIYFQQHGIITSVPTFVMIGSRRFEHVVAEDIRCDKCERDTCAHCPVQVADDKIDLREVSR